MFHLVYFKYVVLSRKNRKRIIKCEQIIIQGCVMAYLKGLDNLYLEGKTVRCKFITSDTTAKFDFLTQDMERLKPSPSE